MAESTKSPNAGPVPGAGRWSENEDKAGSDLEKGTSPQQIKGGQRRRVCSCCSCSKAVVVAAVGMMCTVYMLALGLGLGLGLPSDATSAAAGDNSSRRVIGAVAADHTACSEVGRDFLAMGGSAVDAAIATLLCVGVRQPHSMGIGGGVFLAVYRKSPQAVDMFDGREVAPSSGTYENYFNKSLFEGGFAIGVPGEIKAYWQAHQKYGRLPWKDLFLPAIKMAAGGHPLSRASASALDYMKNKLPGYPALCKIFCKADGKTPKEEGELVYMPVLARTLEGFAKQGPDYLYGPNSPAAADLIRDITAAGGLLKREDLETYRVVTAPPVVIKLGDLTLYTMTAPSGGPVLGLALKMMSNLGMTPADISNTERHAAVLHRMVESFKFAYADRLLLADPAFSNISSLLQKMTSSQHADRLSKAIDIRRTYEPEHYTNLTAAPWRERGTTHISIISPDGDAVSATSSINHHFGSKVVSEATGIILNNHMDDFTTPDSRAGDAVRPNSILPGKRPLSSMAPAIIVDKNGNPRLALGSAGGARITTSNAQVVARILWLKQPLKDAINEKRVHHQLFPNVLVWEAGFSPDLLKELEKYGHVTQPRSSYMSVVQAAARDPDTGEVTAFSDPRKHAEARLLYEDEVKASS